MVIRIAEPEDLNAIAELYVRNHKETYRGLLSDQYLDGLTVRYAREKWEKQLNLPETEILAAYEEDTFLGFEASMPDPHLEKTWYLDSLHVSGDARGKGTGTALIRTSAYNAYKKGFRKMSVCIVRGNDHARTLYRKLGAEHFTFFEDDFCGTTSASEKLVWQELPV